MTNDSSKSIATELLEVQRTLGWMDLVIGSINDAVYVTDKDDHIVFANQFFSDMVGKPRVFLLGELLHKVFRVSDATGPVGEYFDRPVAPSEAKDRLNGIYEWSDARQVKHIFRIYSQQLVTTSQTVYLAQDITREYESARMKSSFIDLASHQLRTPMTAIMTYANMLHDGFGGELTESQKKLSATVISASERMVKLVNDLLTITRIQNSGKSLSKQKLTLRKLFEKIDSEVRHGMEDKQLTYKVIPNKHGCWLMTDESILHEIVSNLIVNATQYTPAGGSITVTYDCDEMVVRISIKDTGIGIPEEYQSEMFKQFSRADNALLAYPAGTGLGLYVIKLLLDKLDATIECNSKVGVGTTFTVSIPRNGPLGA